MTLFICHECGYESKKTGICPKCKKALKSTCPVCGEEEVYCTCTGFIPHTKDMRKRVSYKKLH